MDFPRRAHTVFRPNIEWNENQNCTAEIVTVSRDSSDFVNWATYVTCSVVIILHVRHHSSVGTSFITGLVVSAVGLALTPVFLSICGLFTVYRYIVSKLLAKEEGFMGIMEGSDAYWAGEQTYARSVINILCMVNFTELRLKGKVPIEALRDLMKKIIEGEASHKFRCKKKLSGYGYYYLQKCDVNLTENIRHMGSVETKSDLQRYVSEVANEPLVNDSFWEVRVGQEPLNDSSSTPVLFRVHHALGDGYALVQLFLEFMVDKQKNAKFVRKESVLERLVNGVYKRRAIDVIATVINKVVFYIYGMVVMTEQLVKPPDQNSLHNRIYLNGKKICRWLEMDLNKIKAIRRKLDCRFTDVVLTFLSNSLEHCFVSWGENVDKINIVLPIRFPGCASNPGRMANTFSVAMFDLPLTGKGKFGEIQTMGEKLRSRPDFYINYWLLQIGFTVFPATFMSKLVTSRLSTMALSNVPGPQVPCKLVGCEATDLVFLLPNRDTTGVGISMLSYANKFNVGISIDSSLLTSEEQVDQILEGISNSMKQMYGAVMLHDVK